MRIVVFGATGATGKLIVARALEQGHQVTAAVRKPDAVTTKHEQLKVVQADVLDEKLVSAAVAGAECVMSAIGPASNSSPGTIISVGIKNMVAACEQNKVPRIIFESGLTSGDGSGLSWFGRWMLSLIASTHRALVADKRTAEATITESKLDWVIVRPAGLSNGARTGTCVTGVNAPLNVLKFVSRADVADFMVKVAGDAQMTRTIQSIGH